MKVSRTRYTPGIVWLCLVVFAGCVEDPDVALDAGVDADGAAGTSSLRDAKTEVIASTRIECGSAVCTSPPFAGGFLTACCADQATSTCGLTMSGGPCPKPVAGDPRCPALNFMGIIVVPSCCTAQGECGLDGWMYGLPGCIDLASATVLARSIGVRGEFPKPRTCNGAGDEVGSADQDAGS